MNHDVQSRIDEARGLLEQGNLVSAHFAVKKVLRKEPDNVTARMIQAEILQRSGRFGEAMHWYQKALEVQPDNAVALNNLGGVLQAQGRLDEAVACYREAISARADFAEAHYNLGNALKEQGQLDEAVASYRQAISIKPGFAEAVHNLAHTQQEQGRMEEAVAAYQEAISIDPGFAEAYNNVGLLFEKMNDLARAEEYIGKALDISPSAANIKYAQSVILRRKGQIDDAIRLLESIDLEHVRDRIAAKNIHFELGRLYDRREDSAKAFHHISHGNRLHAEGYGSAVSRKDEFLSDIDAIERALTRDWVRSWPDVPQAQAATPAFIVGFPRSGTTLLDQILDSHPALQVMEEKEAIGEVVQSISGEYPRSLASLREPAVQQLRELYFDAVDGYITREPDTLLVDKFPLNIRHIPLITRLFPGAGIILAMRHPCDVVLSNFMQNYKINNAMANFFTIGDSALAYTRVMGLWQKSISLLPVNYHTVKYESLVADFDNEVARLLRFLGVEWDDAVLEYDRHARNRGTIRTPSYQSVTEPIYQRAKYRWKRYEDQLEPVMGELEPFIEAFGYRG
jgi:tetratricopeptide (TPR) repeat protein